jgi:hypothetical protein
MTGARRIMEDFFLDNRDRREHERFESTAMVRYFIKKCSTRYMDCELVDISRSGIAIRLSGSEEAFVGMDVVLEITLPRSLDHITVKGTIAWSQSTGTGLVGIRFENLIAPEVLTRLVAC